MKIALGADHGGYELKEVIKKYLLTGGYEVIDFGCGGKESVDYPDYGVLAGRAVAGHAADRGILTCTTGVGMSIAANKLRGIRAALCSDAYTAKMSRLHNDANVLVLGSKTVNEAVALEIVKVWISTAFEGGRHQRRIDKIRDIEK